LADQLILDEDNKKIKKKELQEKEIPKKEVKQDGKKDANKKGNIDITEEFTKAVSHKFSSNAYGAAEFIC